MSDQVVDKLDKIKKLCEELHEQVSRILCNSNVSSGEVDEKRSRVGNTRRGH